MSGSDLTTRWAQSILPVKLGFFQWHLKETHDEKRLGGKDIGLRLATLGWRRKDDHRKEANGRLPCREVFSPRGMRNPEC
jgi:hypothetical protein